MQYSLVLLLAMQASAYIASPSATGASSMAYSSPASTSLYSPSATPSPSESVILEIPYHWYSMLPTSGSLTKVVSTPYVKSASASMTPIAESSELGATPSSDAARVVDHGVVRAHEGFRTGSQRFGSSAKKYQHANIAPIAPMADNIAPVSIEKPHGKDEGNSFCMGTCFASRYEAACPGPYQTALYQGKGCWECCFTSPGF